MIVRLVAPLCVLGLACKSAPEPVAPQLPPTTSVAEPTPPAPPAAPAARRRDALPRAELNRWAVRSNLPLYWIADADRDGDLDPDEVASLRFYPTSGASARWVDGGAFTADFERAYEAIVAASRAPLPSELSADERKRQELVGRDLDQGRPTLVRTDLRASSAGERAFVGHMLKVADLIDALYELHNGSAALADKLPPDAASRSLFRRNRGPRCVGPATDHEPLCSAIPGSPRPIFDLYPAALQTDDKFCRRLERRRDAKALLAPFVVVRGTPAKLTAVPYSEAYQEQMGAIAAELTAAADRVDDPSEQPLVRYLRAAARSFQTNDWTPADEAWAAMTVDNSKWYVRVGPDEVYWEPCSRKGGFHLTFARINQASRAWQQKLAPIQQEMEAAVAARAGKPYAARKVTFHLPDFIDIVLNAGDDRDPLGATIGQSLPNWGPVANEGRGRTVAMVNLFTDPDSRAARRAQAASLLTADSMQVYPDALEPGLLGVILHEATHNLGPAHEYKVAGKTGAQVFGGPTASMMEELKAQTGALFLFEMLRGKKLIDDQVARQSYVDQIVWAMGHISQGMYDGQHKPKTYSHVAAIQIGYLIDHGVLTWDAAATAANGKDRGAFTIHLDKIVSVVDALMKQVAGIKARGDRAAAAALIARYVDGTAVPHALITERFTRFPKGSLVYAVEL